MKLRPLLVLTLCSTLLLTGCLNQTTPPSDSGSGSGVTSASNTLSVSLYLPNDNADGFDVVTETITDDPLTMADQLIAALVARDVLPDGCEVLSFDMTKSIPPQLRLNLSQPFADALNSTGTAGERMIMGSVVNTFLTAYDADQIVVNAEGKVIQTGHSSYDEPLRFFHDQEEADSLFSQCAPDAPANALAVIVNEPFEASEAGQLLAEYQPTHTFAREGRYDRAYIVPRLENSEIELFEVDYDMDSGEFHKKQSLFSCISTADTLIYGAFDRPDGVPLYMVTVSAEDAYGEYVLSYNGRDGTPPLEYVQETQ